MITDSKKELLKHYSYGLQLYKKRMWNEALEEFNKALAVDSDDGPSRLYVNRCIEYQQNPPPENWDGVYIMKTK